MLINQAPNEGAFPVDKQSRGERHAADALATGLPLPFAWLLFVCPLDETARSVSCAKKRARGSESLLDIKKCSTGLLLHSKLLARTL